MIPASYKNVNLPQIVENLAKHCFKFVLFNANYSSTTGGYSPRKGDVVLSTENIANEYITKHLKYVHVIEFDKLLQSLDAEDDNFTNILILRTGGIGDLLALSSICEIYADKTVTIATQPKYAGIFKWFKHPPHVVDISKAILNNYKPFRYNTWRKLDIEGFIEAGIDKNWFEVFFDCANLEYDTDLFRPQLRRNILHDPRLKEKSILICNKSSCMMRSIEFMEIYNALPAQWLKDYTIYAYKDNLTTPAPEGVQVLEQGSLDDYLNELYDAKLVISVDSAALHFREGIERLAIGLYNSFTTDCRTKYYRYTKSYDIRAGLCDMQPCFLHETFMPFCPMVAKWQFSAPCVIGIEKQLREIFEDYKLNSLWHT
jgi:hypothetical protein